MKTNLNLLYKILQMTQEELFNFLKIELKKYYKYIDNSGKGNHFIYCRGSEPILLVAHLDTVFENNILYNTKYSDYFFDDEIFLQDTDNLEQLEKEIFYDAYKGVMWSPDGLGADDRAGVYMILTMLEEGLRPHVVFTTDEETGGYGAKIFAHRYENILKKNINDIKYVVELDRHGSNDCVFYSCDNKEFEKYINSFGFQTQIGTFSDISIICPKIGIAGVNLSVGYFNEHSTHETLNVFTMCKIYDIIYNMIEESIDIKNTFIYQEKIFKHSSSIFKFNTDFKCAICNNLGREFFRIDKVGFVCQECMNECMKESVNDIRL